MVQCEIVFILLPVMRTDLEYWHYQRWREQCGKDLYPVLRLILPQKDRERTMYGLKEKMIAKAYIKLIPLGAKDPDAVRLLNWKRPTEKDVSILNLGS
jgi:DNA ligase-4